MSKCNIQNIKGLGPVFVSLGYDGREYHMGIDVVMEDMYAEYLFNLERENIIQNTNSDVSSTNNDTKRMDRVPLEPTNQMNLGVTFTSIVD